MAMGTAAQLGLGALGAGLALYGDRALPQEWSFTLGQDLARGQAGVTITPGTLAAGAAGAALLLLGNKLPGHALLTPMVVGALAAEGGRVADQSLFPMVESLLGAPRPGALPAGTAGVYGLPFAYNPAMQVSEYELAGARY